MQTIFWTNYVALRDKILPLARDGRCLRPDLTLAVGVGADGGWELNRATPVMREAAKLNLACCYSFACIAAYRRHSFASWTDERVWLAIAVRVEEVIHAARAAGHRLLCIDIEPYLGEGSCYPRWPVVGGDAGEMAATLVAASSLLSALDRWRGLLGVAPGGIEYGLTAFVLARRKSRALWLDEFGLFARGRDDMAAAAAHWNRRVDVAYALDNNFAPGVSEPVLHDAEAFAAAEQWAETNAGYMWIHQNTLSQETLDWLFPRS